MITFKQVNQNPALDRTFSFDNLNHTYIGGIKYTMFDVWEVVDISGTVNNPPHIVYEYLERIYIKGKHYKRFENCAKNWINDNITHGECYNYFK